MKKETAAGTNRAFYKNLVQIWLGSLLLQLISIAIVYLIEPSAFRLDLEKPILDANAVIIVIFAIAGIANFAMSLVIRKRFIAQALSDKNPHLLQTAVIAGCALSGSVSLFGLMLAFIASYPYFYAWIALGILGMIFHFPLKKNLVAFTD